MNQHSNLQRTPLFMLNFENQTMAGQNRDCAACSVVIAKMPTKVEHQLRKRRFIRLTDSDIITALQHWNATSPKRAKIENMESKTKTNCACPPVRKMPYLQGGSLCISAMCRALQSVYMQQLTEKRKQKSEVKEDASLKGIQKSEDGKNKKTSQTEEKQKKAGHFKETNQVGGGKSRKSLAEEKAKKSTHIPSEKHKKAFPTSIDKKDTKRECKATEDKQKKGSKFFEDKKQKTQQMKENNVNAQESSQIQEKIQLSVELSKQKSFQQKKERKQRGPQQKKEEQKSQKGKPEEQVYEKDVDSNVNDDKTKESNQKTGDVSLNISSSAYDCRIEKDTQKILTRDNVLNQIDNLKDSRSQMKNTVVASEDSNVVSNKQISDNVGIAKSSRIIPIPGAISTPRTSQPSATLPSNATNSYNFYSGARSVNQFESAPYLPYWNQQQVMASNKISNSPYPMSHNGPANPNCWYNNAPANSSSHGNSNFNLPYLNNIWTQNQHHIAREKFHFGNHMNIPNDQSKMMRPQYRGPTNIPEMWNGNYNRNFPSNCDGSYRMGMNASNYIGSSGMRPRSDCIWTQNAMIQSSRNTFSGNRYLDCNKMVPNRQTRPISRVNGNNALKSGIINKNMNFLNREIQPNIPSILPETDNRKPKEFDKMMPEMFSEGPNFSSLNRAKTSSSLTPINHSEESNVNGGIRESSDSFQAVEYSEMCFTRGQDILSRAIESALILGDMDEEAVLRMDQEAHLMELDNSKKKIKSQNEETVDTQKDCGKPENKEDKLTEKIIENNDRIDIDKSKSPPEADSTQPKVQQEDEWERRVAIEELLEKLIDDVCHLQRYSSKDSLNDDCEFPSNWDIYERDVDESSCNTDLPLRLSPSCDSDYDIETDDFASNTEEKMVKFDCTEDESKQKRSSPSYELKEDQEVEEKDEVKTDSSDKSLLSSEETKSGEKHFCNPSDEELLNKSNGCTTTDNEETLSVDNSDISDAVQSVIESLISVCERLCEDSNAFESKNKSRISLKFSMRMLRQMEQSKHMTKLARRFRKMSLINMSRKRRLGSSFEEGSLDSLYQNKKYVSNLDQPTKSISEVNGSLTESASTDTNAEEDPEILSTPSSSSDVPSLLCHTIIDKNYIIKSVDCKERDGEIKSIDQSDVETVEEVMESLVQRVEKLSRIQDNGNHNSVKFNRSISMDMVDKLAEDIGRDFQFQPDETESFKESARRILLRENSASSVRKKKRKVMPLKFKMKIASPRENEMDQDGLITHPCILQEKIRLRRQKKNDEHEGMLTRMRSLRHRGGDDVIAVDFDDPLPVEYRVRRKKRPACSSQSIERIVLSKKIVQRNIPGKIHKRTNNKQSDRRQRKKIRRKQFPRIEKIFMLRSRKTKMDNGCSPSALDLSFKRVEIDDDSELGPELVIDESSFAEPEPENTGDTQKQEEDSPTTNGTDQPLNLSNKKSNSTGSTSEASQTSVIPQRNPPPLASPLVADPAPTEVTAQEPAKEPSPSSSPVFIEEVPAVKKVNTEELQDQEQVDSELPRITNVISLSDDAFEAVEEPVQTVEPQIQVPSVQAPQSIPQQITTPPAASRPLPPVPPPVLVQSTAVGTQQTQQQMQDREVYISAQYEKLKKELATLEVVALIKERERNNILRLKQYKQAIMRKLQLRQMLIHSNTEPSNKLKSVSPNVIASSTLGAASVPSQNITQKPGIPQQSIIPQQQIIQQQTSTIPQQPIIQQQPVLQQQPIISTSALQVTGLNNSQLSLPQLYVSAAPIPTVVRVAPSMVNPVLSAGHQLLSNQHGTTTIVNPAQNTAVSSPIMVAGKPIIIPKPVNDRNQGLSSIETVVSNARQNFGLQLQGWMDDGQGMLLPLFQTMALTAGKAQQPQPFPLLQTKAPTQPALVQRVDAATSTNSAQEKQLVKKRMNKSIDEIIQSVYTRNLKHGQSPPAISTQNSKTTESDVQTSETTARSPVVHHQMSTNNPLTKPASITEPKPRSQLAQLLMNPAINQREAKDLEVTTVLSSETKANPKFPHGGTAMVTSNSESGAISKDNEKIKFNLDRLKSKWPMCRGCLVRQARFVCAGCSNQWYCSIPCQVKNWKQHFKMCHR